LPCGDIHRRYLAGYLQRASRRPSARKNAMEMGNLRQQEVPHGTRRLLQIPDLDPLGTRRIDQPARRGCERTKNGSGERCPVQIALVLLTKSELSSSVPSRARSGSTSSRVVRANLAVCLSRHACERGTTDKHRRAGTHWRRCFSARARERVYNHRPCGRRPSSALILILRRVRDRPLLPPRGIVGSTRSPATRNGSR